MLSRNQLVRDVTDFQSDLNGWEAGNAGLAFFDRCTEGGEAFYRGVFTLSRPVLSKVVEGLIQRRVYLCTFRVRRSSAEAPAIQLNLIVGEGRLVSSALVSSLEWSVVSGYFTATAASTKVQLHVVGPDDESAFIGNLNIDIDDFRIVDPVINRGLGDDASSWRVGDEALAHGADIIAGGIRFTRCQGSLETPLVITYSSPEGVYPHGKYVASTNGYASIGAMYGYTFRFAIDGVSDAEHEVINGLFTERLSSIFGGHTTVQLELISNSYSDLKSFANMAVYELSTALDPGLVTQTLSLPRFRDESVFENAALNGWQIEGRGSLAMEPVQEGDHGYLASHPVPDGMVVLRKTFADLIVARNCQISFKTRCSDLQFLEVAVSVSGLLVLPYTAVDHDQWTTLTAQFRTRESSAEFVFHIRSKSATSSSTVMLDFDDIIICERESPWDGWMLSDAALQRGASLTEAEDRLITIFPTRNIDHGHSGVVISRTVNGLAGARLKFSVKARRLRQWPVKPELSISLNGEQYARQQLHNHEWVTLEHEFLAPSGDSFVLGIESHVDGSKGNDFEVEGYELSVM